MVTIYFNNRDDENNGFCELLDNKVTIISTSHKHNQQRRYVIQNIGLQILDSKGIKYNIDNSNDI
jgi:hypothetical protein